MTYFLAKTEPTSYSIDQLRQDLRTTWDGVKNPQAVKAIQSMQPGRSCLHLSQRRAIGHRRPGGGAQFCPRRSKRSQISSHRPQICKPHHSTDHLDRSQTKQTLRRLGPGPPKPLVDHGCPRSVRRLDARALPGPPLLKRPYPFHQGIHQRDRQADHIQIVTFDSGDEFRSQSLDGVRARLVHRLP